MVIVKEILITLMPSEYILASISKDLKKYKKELGSPKGIVTYHTPWRFRFDTHILYEYGVVKIRGGFLGGIVSKGSKHLEKLLNLYGVSDTDIIYSFVYEPYTLSSKEVICRRIKL